jgi:hypothetical protein
MEENYMIDSDNGADCFSPYHNPEKCSICRGENEEHRVKCSLCKSYMENCECCVMCFETNENCKCNLKKEMKQKRKRKVRVSTLIYSTDGN